jgi:hypothetical protein
MKKHKYDIVLKYYNTGECGKYLRVKLMNIPEKITLTIFWWNNHWCYGYKKVLKEKRSMWNIDKNRKYKIIAKIKFGGVKKSKLLMLHWMLYRDFVQFTTA